MGSGRSFLTDPLQEGNKREGTRGTRAKGGDRQSMRGVREDKGSRKVADSVDQEGERGREGGINGWREKLRAWRE